MRFSYGLFGKPVQFKIKQLRDDNNRVYMVVAMTKIETGVMGRAETTEKKSPQILLPVSRYRLADVFREINLKDANFLKYVPNDFLTSEQKRQSKLR